MTTHAARDTDPEIEGTLRAMTAGPIYQVATIELDDGHAFPIMVSWATAYSAISVGERVAVAPSGYATWSMRVL